MKGKNRDSIIKVLKLTYSILNAGIILLAWYFFYTESRTSASILNAQEIKALNIALLAIPTVLFVVQIVMYASLPNKIAQLLVLLGSVIIAPSTLWGFNSDFITYLKSGGLFSALSMLIAVGVGSAGLLMPDIIKTFIKRKNKLSVNSLKTLVGAFLIIHLYVYLGWGTYLLSKYVFYLDGIGQPVSVVALVVFIGMLGKNSFDVFAVLRRRYLYAQENEKVQTK
jgi:hypothetical protein